ncbi:MAG: hypothetical protein ACRDEA_14535 [Microcystaceae cyanobacterium]
MFTKDNFLMLSIVSGLLLLNAVGCGTQQPIAQEQQAPQGEVVTPEMAEHAEAKCQEYKEEEARQFQEERMPNASISMAKTAFCSIAMNYRQRLVQQDLERQAGQ